MWADAAKDGRLAAILHQNEGLLATVRELELPNNAPLVFLCECTDPFCAEYVKLAPVEYEARRSGGGFVTCTGHPLPRSNRHVQAA